MLWVYLKIVDEKDPTVCKYTEKRKETIVLLVASGGCELQANCFVFLFGWVCYIWGGSRRGAWALGFEPCSLLCVTVSSPWLPLGKGEPLRGLFNQFNSVAQSCPTLCDLMNRSKPGLPVHHQLPEFTLTHIHRVGDAIQPSHSLSSPFPPASNPSQHQSLFQWVNSSYGVAKVLEFQL